jgi:hypothetical protein
VKAALQLPAGYPELLQDLKSRIRDAQLRISFAVSRESVLLYWSICREILERQRAEGWGAKVIDRLSHDLQLEFPGVEGYSPRNLKYMRTLAEVWPGARKSATACGTFARLVDNSPITLGHRLVIQFAVHVRMRISISSPIKLFFCVFNFSFTSQSETLL